MKRRPSQTLALAGATAVTAACIGAAGGALGYAALSAGDTKTVVRQVTVGSAEGAASTSNLSVGQIYRRSYKGVVEITVTSQAESVPFGGGSQQQRGQGSGLVYDNEGHIVTNQHVVDGATSVSVTFWNGSIYQAKVIGSDASTDLAVLDVDAPASLLSPLQLGDSSKLAVGDGVVAIGSPFGLEGSVTSGIVSALHREMNAPNDFAIDDSIQTDAAINHGNSGGPLLDTRGRVIGVNAQIESESGGNDGVGFAIPSTTVESIVSQLIDSGKVQHAYLGVGLDTIPGSVASQLGLVAGVEVTEVRTGTPAAQADLKAATGSRTINDRTYPTGGDVITAVDGKRVTTADAMRSAIDAKKPGDTIELTYSRDGASHTVEVTLAERPS